MLHVDAPIIHAMYRALRLTLPAKCVAIQDVGDSGYVFAMTYTILFVRGNASQGSVPRYVANGHQIGVLPVGRVLTRKVSPIRVSPCKTM